MLYTNWKEIAKNSGTIIQNTANLRKALQFDNATISMFTAPVTHLDGKKYFNEKISLIRVSVQ